MTYQTSVPVIQNSYASSGYGDDLAIAALWLGLAQNDSTLISEAQGYYDQFQLDAQLDDAVLNWDSVLPAIPILATQIYQSYPQLGGDGLQPRAEAYLDRVVSGQGAGKLTKGSNFLDHAIGCSRCRLGGLLYYDLSSSLASLNPALNAAMLLRRYAPIATSSDKRDAYLVIYFSPLR
jgi:endoglucanase